MVLRGVLEASFGNYICIRGFATLKELAGCTKIDESYQRRPDEVHVRDIADFIRQGEYLYSPEILLGLACDNFNSVEKVKRPFDRSVGMGFEHGVEVRSYEVSLYHALKNMVVPRHESDPKKCCFYNRHFGDLKVTVGQRKNYFDRHERKRAAENEDVPQLFLNVSIYGVENVDGGRPIYCIDGNHRLEAARQDEAVVGRNRVPYCLMLFEDDEECRRKGAMLFHNINYHALRIADELNNRIIVKGQKSNAENLFTDEALLALPSLGRGEYYFVRKTLEKITQDCDSFRSDFFQKIFAEDAAGTETLRPMTFLHSIYEFLLGMDSQGKRKAVEDLSAIKAEKFNEVDRARKDGGRFDDGYQVSEEYAKEVDAFVAEFVKNLQKVDEWLSTNNDLRRFPRSNAVVAALVCFLYFDDRRYYSGFLDYATKRKLGLVKDLKVSEAVELFESQMDRMKRTIFISMPFYRYSCDYHYMTIKSAIDDVNKEFEHELGDEKLSYRRVDNNEDGKTFEINQRVIDGVAECGLLIADLTYSNVNVFHEVGMLMGRTYALHGHTNEFDMILLCDESESSVKNVEFNLHSLQIVCFKEPDELKAKIKERLLKFYGLTETKNQGEEK